MLACIAALVFDHNNIKPDSVDHRTIMIVIIAVLVALVLIAIGLAQRQANRLAARDESSFGPPKEPLLPDPRVHQGTALPPDGTQYSMRVDRRKKTREILPGRGGRVSGRVRFRNRVKVREIEPEGKQKPVGRTRCSGHQELKPS